jgi:hypothetical protein
MVQTTSYDDRLETGTEVKFLKRGTKSSPQMTTSYQRKILVRAPFDTCQISAILFSDAHTYDYMSESLHSYSDGDTGTNI